jgi:hypothetical protein
MIGTAELFPEKSARWKKILASEEIMNVLFMTPYV